jgi:(R,R)-butanediol dehydrogenase/meso-butanediol dehydrogenase/diacetyl reductase
MKAAVLHGPNDLRIETVPDPRPKPDQVILKIAHNGICGSDLRMIEEGMPFSTDPHPVTGWCGPQIIGHEMSGEIVELGSEVSAWTVGDRVTVQPSYACGTCDPCTRDFDHLCSAFTVHGGAAAGGGLSEWTAVGSGMLHRLPDSASLAQGALVEPLSVGRHAVRLADASPGDSALVVGAGPIGLSVTLSLIARGVDNILIAEPSAGRQTLLAELGLACVSGDAEEVVAAAREISAGRGVDHAFDCAGHGNSFDVALASTRARGTATFLAGHWYPVELDRRRLRNEQAIRGSLAYERQDFKSVVRDLDALTAQRSLWVSHVPLDDVLGDDGVAALRDGRRMKVLVDL